MADDAVDRGADALRESTVPQRRRVGANANAFVMHTLVNLICGNAWLDLFARKLADPARHLTCRAHLFNLLLGLEFDYVGSDAGRGLYGVLSIGWLDDVVRHR